MMSGKILLFYCFNDEKASKTMWRSKVRAFDFMQDTEETLSFTRAVPPFALCRGEGRLRRRTIYVNQTAEGERGEGALRNGHRFGPKEEGESLSLSLFGRWSHSPPLHFRSLPPPQKNVPKKGAHFFAPPPRQLLKWRARET